MQSTGAPAADQRSRPRELASQAGRVPVLPQAGQLADAGAASYTVPSGRRDEAGAELPQPGRAGSSRFGSPLP